MFRIFTNNTNNPKIALFNLLILNILFIVVLSCLLLSKFNLLISLLYLDLLLAICALSFNFVSVVLQSSFGYFCSLSVLCIAAVETSLGLGLLLQLTKNSEEYCN